MFGVAAGAPTGMCLAVNRVTLQGAAGVVCVYRGLRTRAGARRLRRFRVGDPSDSAKSLR